MSIQSLERAFEILNVINKNDGASRAAEIAQRVNLPRTTVIRMLSTLEQVGAVQRIDQTNAFEIGPTLHKFGNSKSTTPNLKKIARPTLETLAKQTGETVYLCTLSGYQVYYLDQVSSQHQIRLQSWIGQYLPVHTTAPGKVFIAHMPTSVLEAYLKTDLETFTSKTIIDPDEIRAYAKQIRQDGYGWTYGQTELGLIGVAAPIFDPAQAVIGAVSLGGPEFRFPKANQEQQTAELVVRAAREISTRMYP